MTRRPQTSAYVSEVDYPTGFYANQAPAHLAFVCALNGVAAPDPGGRYREGSGRKPGATLTVPGLGCAITVGHVYENPYPVSEYCAV